ncbi:MAG: leucine-rich repeat domain-containing protein [Bacteroidetes bacterium]|nr:MAG: leucine-rich repeat domain-containing protein [Bacteroidota bacterium]
MALIKREFLLLCFLILGGFLNAQCKICYTLQEASMEPMMVEELYLKSNGLKAIPTSIQTFSNLRKLDLSYNGILKVEHDFSLNPKLEEVNFSNNVGLIPEYIDSSFFDLPIKKINLAGCYLDHLDPRFGMLKGLKELNLENNELIYLPESLHDLKLEVLNLSFNKLQGIDSRFELMYHLKHISVQGNRGMDLNPSLQSLSTLRNLKSISISLVHSQLVPLSLFQRSSVDSLYITAPTIQSLDNEHLNGNSIKTIVFDECIFVSGTKLFDQLNRIESLEKIVFKNCLIDNSLEKLNKISRIELQESKVSNLDELNARMNNLHLIFSNQDVIANEEEENLMNENRSLFPITDNMRRNEIQPIAQQKGEEFKIDADTPCEITSKQATFEIPKQAFRNPDGSAYTGEVSIRLKSYNDPITMAIEGTPMIYQDSQKDELFGSNGMFEFRAYDSKGGELLPNPDALIQVSLNNISPGTNAKVYAFDEQQRNWKIQETPETLSPANDLKRVLDSLKALNDTNFVAIRSFPPAQELEIRKNKYGEHILHVKLSPWEGERFQTGKRYIVISPDNKGMYRLQSEWVIDTALMEDWQVFSEAIYQKKFFLSSWYSRKHPIYASQNRVEGLKLKKNLNRDHFEIWFKYHGEEMFIPVKPKAKNSMRLAETERFNKEFFKDYQKAIKRDSSDYAREFKKAEKKFAKYAAERRLTLAYELINNLRKARIYREQLKFGLSNFGLINCDYFVRHVPERFMHLDDVGNDLNGDTVKLPEHIRMAILEDNAYLELDKNRVPWYKDRKTVAFFSISALEIAVVRSWKKVKNFYRPIVEKIRIEGLSPDEIKLRILK